MPGLIGFLIAAGVIAAFMILGGSRYSGDFSQDDMMRAGYLAVLASFVGWGFFSGGWRNVRRDMRDLVFWFGAILVVAGAYSFKDDARAVFNRVGGALVPGLAVPGLPGEVVITRSQGGMFLVDGTVNGTALRFIFDTGASGVSLTAADAKAAGIVPLATDYSIETSTANGTAMVAPVILDSLTIGSIRLKRVQATVSKEGALSRSLLGHTFLDRLQSYEVRGDRLILRGD